MPYKDPVQRRETQKTYQSRWRNKQTPERKAERQRADVPAKSRYCRSEKGKAKRHRWFQTGPGIDCRRRHQYTPKAISARLRGRAKRRGLAFDLTVQDVASLIAPMKCAVTGLELQWGEPGTKCLLSPSIDRIDNARGYTRDNVQCVALWVNLARSDAPLEDFQAVLKQLFAQDVHVSCSEGASYAA